MAAAASIHVPTSTSFQELSEQKSRIGPACKPVDMVHLAKQSLGDRFLEQEILKLFQSQSRLYLERLENAGSQDERRLAAHTILGSARSIGAWEVAREAEAIQLGAPTGDVAFEALRFALDAANDYIGSIIDT